MNPYLRAARQLPALVAQAVERLAKRREDAGRRPVEPGPPAEPGRPDQPGPPGGRGKP